MFLFKKKNKVNVDEDIDVSKFHKDSGETVDTDDTTEDETL